MEEVQIPRTRGSIWDLRDSEKYLDSMAGETLPFIYRQSIAGMQQMTHHSHTRTYQFHLIDLIDFSLSGY